MALGASRFAVVKVVLLEGVRPIGWGVLVGALAGGLLTRSMESLLVDVRASYVSLAVAALVLVCSTLAGMVAVARLTRVNPQDVLRAE
jgi:ABC-type antimicrobial peptide transport system permease subunit